MQASIYERGFDFHRNMVSMLTMRWDHLDKCSLSNRCIYLCLFEKNKLYDFFSFCRFRYVFEKLYIFVKAGNSSAAGYYFCKSKLKQDPAGRKLNISEYLFLFLVFVRVGYTGQGRIRPIQHQSFSAVRKTARWSTEIVSRWFSVCLASKCFSPP